MRYLLLGGAQLAVGAAAIFARYALAGSGPLAVGAARLSIAAIILVIASMIAHGHATRAVTVRENRILAIAGIALAIHFATWIGSLDYTTIAISTLIVSTTPIWTALYDAIVWRRRFSRVAIIAFATGIAATLAIAGFNTTASPHPGLEWFGWLLALIGSMAIGAYFILVREVRDELGTRAIVSRTYSWAALALVLAAVAARQPLPPIAVSAAWGGILAMALISQLLGHTALNAALRWFSPSAIAFSTLLEPVIAAGLALWLFHEALPPLAIAGGLVLLISVAVVLREDQGWTPPIV